MILADTSAWVEYDRATGTAVHRRMVQLIAARESELSVTEPVVMEVLAGARTDQRERDLRRLLFRSGCPASSALTGGSGFVYDVVRLAGVLSEGGHHTELAQQADQVDLGPVLDKSAVGDTVDRYTGHGQLTPSWHDSKKLAYVRAVRGDARDDFVTFGDLVLDDVVEVGEGGAEGGGILLHRFTRGRRDWNRRWIVIEVVAREETLKVGLCTLVDLGKPLAH